MQEPFTRSYNDWGEQVVSTALRREDSGAIYPERFDGLAFNVKLFRYKMPDGQVLVEDVHAVDPRPQIPVVYFYFRDNEDGAPVLESLP